MVAENASDLAAAQAVQRGFTLGPLFPKSYPKPFAVAARDLNRQDSCTVIIKTLVIRRARQAPGMVITSSTQTQEPQLGLFSLQIYQQEFPICCYLQEQRVLNHPAWVHNIF